MYTAKEAIAVADKIVNHTMRIKPKPNPHFMKAKRKYPWLKGKLTLKTAAAKARMKEETVKKILEKYSDVKYGPLVIKQGSAYKVKETIGPIVFLKHHADSKGLALAVREECWKNGAHVYMFESSNRYLRRFYELTPEENLAEFNHLDEEVSRNIDYAISLEPRDWAAWSKGIPPRKIKAYTPVVQRRHEIEDKRGVPWLLFGWPFEERAKELGIPFAKLAKIMKDCIMWSYTGRPEILAKKYYKKFTGSKAIRITADDGTDLRFSVKGRRFLIDDSVIDEADIKRRDVGMNIPCGEVFTAPVETSAEGVIIFPHAVVPGQGQAEELKLTFKKGKVVKIEARKGKEYLPAFIAQNSKDADRIAEFGIGLNEKAVFTGGEIIIDEKIMGSIHVAIGWNVGFGGKTNASSHLDFIKDLRERNGKVFADGRIVIDNGSLV